MARPAKTEVRQPKPLPAPNSDFYEVYETLSAEELATVKRVRAFMEAKVAPVVTKYWVDDAFPFELLPAVKELGVGGLSMHGYGCAGGGSLALLGFVQMEIARIDPSFSTFAGVHVGLAMGSIYIDGSEEQKQKWQPPMARFEKIRCFGLTEPLVGSGASRGLLTTAKREGDTWILNGEKRWIGNAPWCDISIIWARDVADNQVKGFIVENKTTPGFSVEKVENKIALKVVQNGHITLKDVRVPEANRLKGGNSFRDTAKVLKMTRYAVVWMATGCAMGAYEAALKYTQERLQFGRPIGSFQLVQDLLAKMIANITASQCLITRQAQLHAEGKLTDAHAALAKSFCTAKCRETVAWARELLGGIVADSRPLLCGLRSARLLRRHVSDAEPDPRKGRYGFRRLRSIRAASKRACSVSQFPIDEAVHDLANA
jgi:alkylation response protein AidB-like acyl-CoA dehydrogenase